MLFSSLHSHDESNTDKIKPILFNNNQKTNKKGWENSSGAGRNTEIVWRVRMNKSIVHLPDRKRRRNGRINGVIEQEELGSSIDSFCGIYSWGNTWSSTLCESFYYRMINLIKKFKLITTKWNEIILRKLMNKVIDIIPRFSLSISLLLRPVRSFHRLVSPHRLPKSTYRKWFWLINNYLICIIEESINILV